MNLKTFGQVLGAVGAAILVTSPILLLFGAAGSSFVIWQAVIGVIMCALYVAFDPTQVGRMLTGRGTFFAATAGGLGLVLVVAVGVVDYVAASKVPKQWDLTKNKIYTLSDETQKTVKGLTTEVHAYAFYTANDKDFGAVKDLLDRYHDLNAKMFLPEFLDPDKNPAKVKELGIKKDSGPALVLEVGHQQDKVQALTEEGLTNAVIKLSHGAEKKIYFSIGHGEADIKDKEARGYAQVVQALENEGVKSETLNLLDTKEIPTDAEALVVAGPQKAFLPQEAQALSQYLKLGGHALIELDPQIDTGLDAVLKTYGMQLNNDEIIDPSSQRLGADLNIPVVVQYAPNSPITKDFTEATIYPESRSLVSLSDPDETRPLALATTNSSAWGETDFAMLAAGRANPEGKLKGALALAMSATKTLRPADAGKRSIETRLVAIGNSSFANNRWARQVGNQDFFMNCVSWLTDSSDRITIRPRSRDASHLAMNQQQSTLVQFFSIDVLPVMLLAVGIAIWRVRRAK
jgi:ABC-type uncharacterized transport system involved in gliding motility auxiliary subunit